MQIIVRKMTLGDWIHNRIFYPLRYKFYTKFLKRKLKDRSPVEKPGWKNTFEDDFDEVSWSRFQKDPRKWGIGEHWGKFHPANGRSWWTEPIFNGDSTISCITRKEPKKFYRATEGGYWYSSRNNFTPVETKVVPYSCGGIGTGHKNTKGETIFKQQYGRWECRCKVPTDKGVRSAYWMWGTTWPPEIDVFEIDGSPEHDDQKINFHYGVNEDTDGDGVKEHPSLGSWNGRCLRSNEWQEFAMEWTPERITLITDGLPIFRLSNKETLKWYNAENAQMWVLVYQSVINLDTIEPDENGIASSFDIDYVRMYEKE